MPALSIFRACYPSDFNATVLSAMKIKALLQYSYQVIHRFSSAHFSIIMLMVFFVLPSCKQQNKLPEFTSNDIGHIVTRMTDIMVRDITNPPLAARFFSYSCLAGYEVIAQNDKKFKSMNGRLNDYPSMKKPDSIKPYSYQLSALLAMIETAKKMQPSGKLLNDYEQKFIDSCRNVGFDDELINNSKKYAEIISKQILNYAKTDEYNKTTNLPKYTPLNKEGSWYPTPPGYIAAVEPYFNTVRSFTLDSAQQFKPSAPVDFNSKKGSLFYNLTESVYNKGKTLTEEHRTIASFWDCNPFAIQDEGHLMYGFKKISPGAHWLGITGIACDQAKKNFNESMEIFTTVSIGLMDAFICCWDEKYRSDRIRPETAIRKLIDPQWEPFLQTPPFPEYPSGHSTISATSATILTHFFGDHFSYTDSVEVSYGLPAKSFTSFHKASEEAAISRFYGGIHFMDAVNNGREQGLKVGEWVLDKLK